MTFCDLVMTPTEAEPYRAVCDVCGKPLVLGRPFSPTLRRECRPGIGPSPRPRPTRTLEENVASLLAAIREVGGELPPWQAIERHARHVCQTGAWSGCDRKRSDWARRVVELAGKPALWPAKWGAYPTT